MGSIIDGDVVLEGSSPAVVDSFCSGSWHLLRTDFCNCNRKDCLVVHITRIALAGACWVTNWMKSMRGAG